MLGSLKVIPELNDLPAAEQKRAWRGGARYALNRLPFLFIALCMLAGMSLLQVYVIEPLVPNKLARFGVSLAVYFVFMSILMRMIIYYARPYWRQLRERDG
jgi:hypothetical protein